MMGLWVENMCIRASVVLISRIARPTRKRCWRTMCLGAWKICAGRKARSVAGLEAINAPWSERLMKILAYPRRPNWRICYWLRMKRMQLNFWRIKIRLIFKIWKIVIKLRKKLRLNRPRGKADFRRGKYIGKYIRRKTNLLKNFRLSSKKRISTI